MISLFSQCSPMFPNVHCWRCSVLRTGQLEVPLRRAALYIPSTGLHPPKVQRCSKCAHLGKASENISWVKPFSWSFMLDEDDDFSKSVRRYFCSWLEGLFLVPSEIQRHLQSGVNHVVQSWLNLWFEIAPSSMRLLSVGRQYIHAYLPTYIHTWIPIASCRFVHGV